MLIIFGNKITEDKKIRFALKEVYGVGISNAHKICDKLNIPYSNKTSDLSEEDKINISAYLKENFVLDSNLKTQKKENIKNYIDINCVRGFRHRSNLPVNGQRTHSNGRTRKRGIV